MKLFCKHDYKFSGKQEVPDIIFKGNIIYNFTYVCTKCGKVINTNERELDSEVYRLKRKYIKNGCKAIESSAISYPRFNDYNICWHGSVITLLIKKYLKKGIDLREIDGRW